MLSLILAMNELILHVFLLIFAVLIIKTQLWKSFFFFFFLRKWRISRIICLLLRKKEGKKILRWNRILNSSRRYTDTELLKLSYSTFCGNFQISISRFYQKTRIQYNRWTWKGFEVFKTTDNVVMSLNKLLPL